MPQTLPHIAATRPDVAEQHDGPGERAPSPSRRGWFGELRLREFLVAPFRDIDNRVRVAGQ